MGDSLTSLAGVLQNHFESCVFVLCNKKTVITSKLPAFTFINGILGICRPLTEE
jgi:hypothetical protein